MITSLYENRDKKISELVKLGDCIGRSLRENVHLFSIDGSTEIVTYITESNMVISGKYTFGKETALHNIKIQDSSIFEDNALYENFINGKVSSFVKSIYEDDYRSAETNFGEILSLWENRLKFDSVQKKLHEKTEKLGSLEKIVESEEFQRFLEIEPQVINFLKTNFNKISKVPEIRNAVNLSNSISEAFKLPRITHEELEAQGTYVLNNSYTSSIYEMICRQELVKKELLESKKEFDTIWASNKAIQNLANCIFESDEKVINALSEALKEVPYLALASKNNLYKTFSSCLASVDGLGVSEKDIQKYASNIFEAKKEVRSYLINAMNEKFGVNVLNLQEPPSFKSLVNTQIIIFETISRLAPNGSTVKKIMSELADSLKNKSGVEAIDVNDVIYEMFVRSGYSEILDENKMLSMYTKVDFKQLANDLQDMASYIKTTQGQGSEADIQYEDDEVMGQEEPEEEQEQPEEEEQEEPEAPEAPEGQAPEMETEGGAEEEQQQPSEEIPEKTKSPEELKKEVAKLEQMVKDLANELNMSDRVKPEEEEND